MDKETNKDVSHLELYRKNNPHKEYFVVSFYIE